MLSDSMRYNYEPIIYRNGLLSEFDVPIDGQTTLMIGGHQSPIALRFLTNELYDIVAIHNRRIALGWRSNRTTLPIADKPNR